MSGGLDSATALYWALREKKWRCGCLLFDYGQRHRRELRAALGLARAAGCPARIVRFRLPWGGSSLLSKSARLPSKRLAEIGKGPVPSTYVPARNTVFLSFALSWADAARVRNIVIGANALDYSGYPDCRPRYYDAVRRVARLGTRLGAEAGKPIAVHAPLIRLTKAAIVRRGLGWGVPYGRTWSCYSGGRRPCRRCDSCKLREEGFRQAGAADPLLKRR